jgi:hypothetical protein
VDGGEHSDVDVSFYRSDGSRGEWTRLSAEDTGAARILGQIPLDDFPDDVGEIRIPCYLRWRGLEPAVVVRREQKPGTLLFRLRPNIFAWAGSVNFATFAVAVKEVAMTWSLNQFAAVRIEQDATFIFEAGRWSERIDAAVERWLPLLSSFKDEVERRIEEQHESINLILLCHISGGSSGKTSPRRLKRLRRRSIRSSGLRSRRGR